MKKLIALIISVSVMILLSVTAAAQTMNIPILCYHDVSNNPFKWSDYTISGSEMEDDIRYFKENGYKYIMPKDMWYANPNDKNIVMSFDDGYESMYTHVFPLLKKYNVKAVMYIIGAKIDKHGYLKSWQIKAMDESGLVEIGNHTNIMHTYQYTVDEFNSNPIILKDFIEDVKDCSAKIYNILGHGTESLAYPSGRYTAQMDNIIHTNLGYTTTMSTNHGLVRNQSDIAWAMNRVYRNHGTTPKKIEQTINSLK